VLATSTPWCRRLVGWLGMLAVLAGCAATPPASRAAADQRGIRLTAEVIAPEALAELLGGDQGPEGLIALQLALHNGGTDALAVVPARAALVGPRHQRIRPVEPSALFAYVRRRPRLDGISTPPYAGLPPASDREIATVLGEKALRPRTLAPGDALQGWLYFPMSGRRAAAEVSERWQLAVVLQGQDQRLQEYIVRVDPPEGGPA
jgi:hypothetical protein